MHSILPLFVFAAGSLYGHLTGVPLEEATWRALQVTSIFWGIGDKLYSNFFSSPDVPVTVASQTVANASLPLSNQVHGIGSAQWTSLEGFLDGLPADWRVITVILWMTVMHVFTDKAVMKLSRQASKSAKDLIAVRSVLRIIFKKNKWDWPEDLNSDDHIIVDKKPKRGIFLRTVAFIIAWILKKLKRKEKFEDWAPQVIEADLKAKRARQAKTENEAWIRKDKKKRVDGERLTKQNNQSEGSVSSEEEETWPSGPPANNPRYNQRRPEQSPIRNLVSPGNQSPRYAGQGSVIPTVANPAAPAASGDATSHFPVSTTRAPARAGAPGNNVPRNQDPKVTDNGPPKPDVPSEPSEPSEPAETGELSARLQFVKPNATSKSTMAPKPRESTRPAGGSQAPGQNPSGSSKPHEPSKPTEVNELSARRESLKPDEATKSTEAPKPDEDELLKPTEAPTPGDSSSTAGVSRLPGRPSGSSRPGDSLKPTEATKPVEPPKPTAASKPTGASKPGEPSKAVPGKLPGSSKFGESKPAGGIKNNWPPNPAGPAKPDETSKLAGAPTPDEPSKAVPGKLPGSSKFGELKPAGGLKKNWPPNPAGPAKPSGVPKAQVPGRLPKRT